MRLFEHYHDIGTWATNVQQVGTWATNGNMGNKWATNGHMDTWAGKWRIRQITLSIDSHLLPMCPFVAHLLPMCPCHDKVQIVALVSTSEIFLGCLSSKADCIGPQGDIWTGQDIMRYASQFDQINFCLAKRYDHNLAKLGACVLI